MADPAVTLRALAEACGACLRAARDIPDNTACVHAQRIALMDALPDVEGWPATADELRTMADTVDRLTRERDEARAELDVVRRIFDEAYTPDGTIADRVDGVLAGRDDALRRLAAAQGDCGDYGGKLGRIADLVFPLGLRGHGDDVEAVVRRVVGRLNGLQVERDAARDARNEAHALLIAAVPVLERDAVRSGNGDVLTRVRAWLGVCDG